MTCAEPASMPRCSELRISVTLLENIGHFQLTLRILRDFGECGTV
jgi:hypothetical protein